MWWSVCAVVGGCGAGEVTVQGRRDVPTSWGQLGRPQDVVESHNYMALGGKACLRARHAMKNGWGAGVTEA